MNQKPERDALIAGLRLGASISRDRKINLDYAKIADEAADALEAQAQRIGELNAQLAQQASMVEKCMVAMNANADAGQKAEAKVAEQAQRITELEKELEAIKAQEPAFVYTGQFGQVIELDFEGYTFGTKFYTAPVAPAQPACPYCDGTGDVHSIDGEWRGICTSCTAQPVNEMVEAQAQRIVELTAELGDLPEAQADMLAEIKSLRGQVRREQLYVQQLADELAAIKKQDQDQIGPEYCTYDRCRTHGCDGVCMTPDKPAPAQPSRNVTATEDKVLRGALLRAGKLVAPAQPLTKEQIREIADCIVANLESRKQVLNLDLEAELVEEIMQEMCDTIKHGIGAKP